MRRKVIITVLFLVIVLLAFATGTVLSQNLWNNGFSCPISHGVTASSTPLTVTCTFRNSEMRILYGTVSCGKPYTRDGYYMVDCTMAPFSEQVSSPQRSELLPLPILDGAR